MKVVREKWRRVPGFEHAYKVSTFGRVLSLARTRRGKSGAPTKVPRRFLKLRTRGNSGYIYVILKWKGMAWDVGVHELVLTTFIGLKPTSNHQACHFPDTCRQNNHLDNLRWGTAVDNARDRKKTNGYAVGGKHPLAVLSNRQARKIRRLHKKGHKQVKLAKMFEVSTSTIHEIVNRKTYQTA